MAEAEQGRLNDPSGDLQAMGRLEIRLRRVEQQVSSFRDLHVVEVADLARKLQAIASLHGDELQLIQDELADIAAELAKHLGADQQQADDNATTAAPDQADDPAARSPKRARWLADEQRRPQSLPMSRRDLLLGREPGDRANG